MLILCFCTFQNAVSVQRHYLITDCIPHPVHSIPMTYFVAESLCLLVSLAHFSLGYNFKYWFHPIGFFPFSETPDIQMLFFPCLSSISASFSVTIRASLKFIFIVLVVSLVFLNVPF